MAPQQQYKLRDFLKFAHGNLPSHLANEKLYRFEKRTFINQIGQTCEATLFFLERFLYTSPVISTHGGTLRFLA